MKSYRTHYGGCYSTVRVVRYGSVKFPEQPCQNVEMSATNIPGVAKNNREDEI